MAVSTNNFLRAEIFSFLLMENLVQKVKSRKMNIRFRKRQGGFFVFERLLSLELSGDGAGKAG